MFFGYQIDVFGTKKKNIMGKYEDLKVWQDSVKLAEEVHALAEKPPFSKDFGLVNQVRRSAVSIFSNIAEGDDSGTNKQCIRHFHIAKGSVAELYSQLNYAKKIGYVTEDQVDPLLKKLKIIAGSLYKLIKYRSGRKKIE